MDGNDDEMDGKRVVCVYNPVKYAHAAYCQRLDKMHDWPAILSSCNTLRELRADLLNSAGFELQVLHGSDWLNDESSSDLPLLGTLYVKVLPAADPPFDFHWARLRPILRYVTDTLGRSVVCSALRAGPALDRKKMT